VAGLTGLWARGRRALRKPPRYLAWRLAEAVRREAQRVSLRAARGGRGRLAAQRILAADNGAALALTRTNVVTLGAWEPAAADIRADPALHGPLSNRADLAERRVVELFGEEPVPAGIPPRWNEDVRNGMGWPLEHYGTIDYRNPGRSSDVKIAWELSRLRHLVHLAQGFAVTSEARYSRAIDEDLLDWNRSNPLGRSVSWSSAMEVALRAVNLVCVDGIALSRSEDGETRAVLVAALYQHGWFLLRNLEISDLNGNHFLANAVGLLWLGRYFEGFGEAARWTKTGRRMALEAARDQIFPDGVDHEGSLPYHVLVLELLLLARHAGGEALVGLDPTLTQMLDALCSFAGPEGRVPNLGDDDGGRVAAFSDTPSRDARRVLALGAALLGHRWAAECAGEKHWEDALWLLGREAIERVEPEASSRPPKRHFAHSGLLVLGEGPDHVVLDAGPVGFRGRGGHGHLDAMSFEALLGGELAVRDSGTGSYTGDPALRETLRDVRAHTVVVVDDLPYARLGGEQQLWLIEGDSPPSVVAEELTDGFHRVVVEQQLPASGGSALHRRDLVWRAGQLDWTDEVQAPRGASIRHYVQLPPGCRIDGDGVEHRLFSYQADLPANATLTLERAPWSEHYGSVQEATRAAVSYLATDQQSVVHWGVRRRA
jgi:hypothetical protein